MLINVTILCVHDHMHLIGGNKINFGCITWMDANHFMLLNNTAMSNYCYLIHSEKPGLHLK